MFVITFKGEKMRNKTLFVSAIVLVALALGACSPTVVANPAHGSISGVNSTDGRITYVPAQNYTGSDQFRYTVKGFNGLTSAQATVTVTIRHLRTRPL